MDINDGAGLPSYMDLIVQPVLCFLYTLGSYSCMYYLYIY